MKNLIVFGATGGTGRELVRQALEQNYNVTAFARNPGKLDLKSEQLSIFQGDVLNKDDVEKAVQNQDAVLCCIGAPGNDKSLTRTKGTANIIEAMQRQNIARLICLSSLGFGDSEHVLPWFMKYIIVPLFIKNAFKDHAEQEKVVEKSNLAWTIARPATLTDESKTGNYRVGFGVKEKITLKISRADVADFMLKQVSDDQYLHQKVALSY